MTATALDYLVNGSVHTAVYMIYTEATGYWWVVLLHLFFIGIVGFESRDEAITAAYALLVSLTLKYFDLIPAWADSIIYIIVVLSIGVLLYWIVRGDS